MSDTEIDMKHLTSHLDFVEKLQPHSFYRELELWWFECPAEAALILSGVNQQGVIPAMNVLFGIAMYYGVLHEWWSININTDHVGECLEHERYFDEMRIFVVREINRRIARLANTTANVSHH